VVVAEKRDMMGMVPAEICRMVGTRVVGGRRGSGSRTMTVIGPIVPAMVMAVAVTTGPVIVAAARPVMIVAAAGTVVVIVVPVPARAVSSAIIARA